jgi:cytidylate kinase
MKRIEDIDRYLRAHFAAQMMPGPDPGERRVHPFVTISRQTGTGGHALADVMLEVFAEQDDVDLFGGWRIYDRTICEMVVQDKRFAGSLDLLVEEEYRSRANDFFHQMLRSTADQTMVMNRVFVVVRAIAGMGKAIIVGRGGSHVTKDIPRGVSLRIVAPEDVRIARAMDVHDLSEKEARAGSRKRDADRARLIRSHFAADIGDPTGYDVTWNVGSASFAEVSRATVSLVRGRNVNHIES